MPRTEPFGYIRMVGGRYEVGGLPLAAARELQQYERVVTEVARELFLRDHPDRRRTSGEFDRFNAIYLRGVGDGSAVPELVRVRPEQAELDDFPDYGEQARRLINEAFAGVARHQRLTHDFPLASISALSRLGSSLRDGERFEFGDTPEESPRAVLDPEVRRNLQSIARLESLQVEVAELGHVVGLRSKPQTFDFLLSESGKQITGTYLDSSVFEDLNSVMGFRDRAPLVAITLIGEASADGELTAITDVLGVDAALPDKWRLRLEELGRLDSGWLSPESPGPTEVALRLTESLLLMVKKRGIEKPGMFAHAEGGVQLEWTTHGRSIEVAVHNDGAAEMCWYSNRMGDDFEGEIESEAVDLHTLADTIAGVLGG